MEIRNRKLTMDEFTRQRAEVLAQWPTGREVDLEEAFGYQRAIPAGKRFSEKLKKAQADRRTLIHPRAGVPLIDEHVRLLNHLETEGEADLLPTTIDSYTRLNRYEEADVGIRESMKLGKAMLNGFPAVNHGVSGCRRVTEAVRSPVQVPHGTPDARLLAEITLAGGFTSFEGGGISYNIPTPRAVAGAHHRRLAIRGQLTGLYEKTGPPINREPFGR
jgi:methylaspartate mutase epsilon subunit